jgi:hypothetical protein
LCVAVSPLSTSWLTACLLTGRSRTGGVGGGAPGHKRPGDARPGAGAGYALTPPHPARRQPSIGRRRQGGDKTPSFEFLSTEPYQTTRSPARPVWGIDSSTVVFCADEFRYQEGVAPGSGEAHPGPSCDPGNGGVSGDSQPSQLIARPQLGNDKDQRLPANRRQGGAVAPHAYLPCSWVLTVGSGLGGVPRTAARRSSTKRSARG